MHTYKVQFCSLIYQNFMLNVCNIINSTRKTIFQRRSLFNFYFIIHITDQFTGARSPDITTHINACIMEITMVLSRRQIYLSTFRNGRGKTQRISQHKRMYAGKRNENSPGWSDLSLFRVYVHSSLLDRVVKDILPKTMFIWLGFVSEFHFLRKQQ